MSKVHKTIEQAGTNLAQAAAFIPARYKDGVSKADWLTPTTSPQAEINYQAGIADAIAKGKRAAGASAAGNAKFQKNASEKGGAVIGTRITAAIPIYKAKFSGVLAAMNSASDSAPARTRDPMANIENRLKPVVMAAIAAKTK